MPFLTIEEFADEEGVTKALVRKYISEGMPAEPGPYGPRIIDANDAREWLEEEGYIDSDDGDDDEEEDEDED